eukprot:GHVU01125132.1.p1 GENE.GHVU01125132.1~~GHVU01125132.1.p1  ORF type:complete len:521 (+),score=99.31 GHVU01125132.1:34-1596(+)
MRQRGQTAPEFVRSGGAPEECGSVSRVQALPSLIVRKRICAMRRGATAAATATKAVLLLPLLLLLSLLLQQVALPVSGLQAHEMVRPGDVQDLGLPAGRERTLVVFESGEAKLSFSTLLRIMEENSDITVATPTTAPPIFALEERKFDNIILVAPEADLSRRSNVVFTATELLQHVDLGGNVLVAATSFASQGQRNFLNNCGFDLDRKGSTIIDVFHPFKRANSSSGSYAAGDAVSVDEVVEARSVFSVPKKGIFFKGTGMLLNPADSQTVAILRGRPTSYSQDAEASMHSGPISSGHEAILVAALQTRGAARVVVSGSVDMFKDDILRESADTELFVRELTQFALRRRGVLRWSGLNHHKVGEEAPPYMYTVEDEIEFEVHIHERRGGSGGAVWEPYKASDVQLEYTMLDPHLRLALRPDDDPTSGRFTARFKAPDVPGIFKFVLLYQRPALSRIHIETLAPLRNFKHDDYPRFLRCAYPYYLSCTSVLGLLVVFAFYFLYLPPGNPGSPRARSSTKVD